MVSGGSKQENLDKDDLLTAHCKVVAEECLGCKGPTCDRGLCLRLGKK